MWWLQGKMSTSGTEAEQEFNDYVDEHNIHGLLKDTIVKLCICKPDDPNKWFYDYFRTECSTEVITFLSFG